MHHGGARSGRTNNRLCLAFFAEFYETLRDASSFSSITRIERRLSTASLALVEFDRAAGAPQHFDRAGADSAPQLIDQARHEQSDSHSIADCRLPIADC